MQKNTASAEVFHFQDRTSYFLLLYVSMNCERHTSTNCLDMAILSYKLMSISLTGSKKHYIILYIILLLLLLLLCLHLYEANVLPTPYNASVYYRAQNNRSLTTKDPHDCDRFDSLFFSLMLENLTSCAIKVFTSCNIVMIK